MSVQNPIRRRASQHGSTLVEFALTVLPMFALLFLTMDLAWLIFGWASINEGVREGVRYAITCQTNADIATRVQQYSFGFVNPGNQASAVTVQYAASGTPTDYTSCPTKQPGCVVKVSISGISLTPMAYLEEYVIDGPRR